MWILLSILFLSTRKNGLLWLFFKKLNFSHLNMPTNVFASTYGSNRNKIDTNLFVQNVHSRTISIEANIEEDWDLKKQNRIKTLPNPISNREACSKNYVDTFSTFLV